MLPAKTESELPERLACDGSCLQTSHGDRSGWVKRMAESLGFLSSWEWRWLVLKALQGMQLKWSVFTF